MKRIWTSIVHGSRKSTSPSVADDPRWARIVARDKTADGHLWYSVVDHRRLLPAVVSLAHRQSEECSAPRHPGEREGHRLPALQAVQSRRSVDRSRECGARREGVRIIEESEEEPSLEELADAVGRSPSYFHRMFKAATGVTPKDYAAAQRAAKVRQGLASGSSVTEAIYDAGFNSSGRFYEKSTDMLGMTPSQYRAGGANEEIKFAVGQTSSRRHIGRVDQEGRRRHPSRR